MSHPFSSVQTLETASGVLPFPKLKHVANRGRKDSKELISRDWKRVRTSVLEAAILLTLCWPCRGQVIGPFSSHVSGSAASEELDPRILISIWIWFR